MLTKKEADLISKLAKQQFLKLGGKLRNSGRQCMKQTKEERKIVSGIQSLESQQTTANPCFKPDDSSIAVPQIPPTPVRLKVKLIKDIKSGENFICHICAFETITQRQLRCHIDQKHRNISPARISKPVRLITRASSEIICDICGVTRIKKFELRKHMRSHEKPLGECEICHLRLRNVPKHIRDVHTDERSFICEVCEAAFKSLHNLKNHVKTHEEPSECPICHKLLPNMHRHLQWHKRPVPARHICNQCSKSCSTKQSLQEHVLRIHEKVPLGKSYSCNDCSLTFIRNNDLRRHSFQHFTGKIFSCTFPNCNEMFKKAFKLQSHMMIHNPKNEMKFACELCDRKYLRKAALNKHRRQTHSSSLV